MLHTCVCADNWKTFGSYHKYQPSKVPQHNTSGKNSSKDVSYFGKLENQPKQTVCGIFEICERCEVIICFDTEPGTITNPPHGVVYIRLETNTNSWN